MNHDKDASHAKMPTPLSPVKDYYQILNIAPGATPKEIREAYFRLKNTYNNNNQALYSLVGGDDLTETLSDIEEAYTTLNHDKQREAYDGLRQNRKDAAAAAATRASAPRPDPTTWMPAAESSPSPAAALAESTSAERSGATTAAASKSSNYLSPLEPNTVTNNAQVLFTYVPPKPRRLIAAGAQEQDIQQKIAEAIADGDPADGSLYKKIRMIVGIEKDELQEHIKISIGYIDNLEQNRFDLLPQPVYVKGFLKSYLKYLGVADCDRLVKAYSEKFTTWFENKHSS